MLTCFDTIHECDGQTDRHLTTTQAMLCTALGGKN